MAADVCRSLAGAVVSPFLKYTVKPPVFLIEIPPKLSSWTFYLRNIKSQNLSRFPILTLHLQIATGLSLWGSWSAACVRSSPHAELPSEFAAPLDSWSQYTIYSTILENGRASLHYLSTVWGCSPQSWAWGLPANAV